MSKVNLSIYLIKECIDNFDDIQENGEILEKYDDDKILYYRKSYSNDPIWMNAFFGFSKDDIKTSNARALLLRRIKTNDGKTRIFALTFGYGKAFFKDDVLEEQFGLKIVLNTINRDKLRKISKVDIGKNYKQSQEQLPKENDISEFGFDVDRDLIKFVSGKSEDEYLNKSILTGGDIFSFTTDKNINNIDELLIYLYDKYRCNNYKEKYPWLDNIKQIREKKLIDDLNQCLIEYLNERKFEDIWLAIPDILNWETIRCVKIQGLDEEMIDIEMNSFISSVADNKILNVNQIKSKKINVYSNETDDVIKSWNSFKCIVGCVEYKGDVYSINSGVWYKIDKNFEREVKETYDKIKISDMDFISCDENFNEDQYNDSLCKHLEGSKMLHKTKISIGGGKGNNIEPCDILYDNNFIHIKSNGGSSYLSHLFNQATISCAFLKDSNFRKKFNEKMNELKIDYHLPEDFNPSNYNVVLGIITRSGNTNSRPKIPFFSKVSIKYAKEVIERNLGYKMFIKNIRK